VLRGYLIVFHRKNTFCKKIWRTSLGLSVAQDLVQIGGEIGVECRVGIGSKFYVEIQLLVGSKAKDDERAYLEVIEVTGVKVLVLEENELD